MNSEDIERRQLHVQHRHCCNERRRKVNQCQREKGQIDDDEDERENAYNLLCHLIKCFVQQWIRVSKADIELVRCRLRSSRI